MHIEAKKDHEKRNWQRSMGFFVNAKLKMIVMNFAHFNKLAFVANMHKAIQG